MGSQIAHSKIQRRGRFRQQRVALLLKAASVALAGYICRPDVAFAQTIDAAANHEVSPIIVTASKREELANRVGMAITAATANELRIRGIDAVSDLPRLIPGLTLQQSSFNSTSLTLRGVGFFNSDLGTPPAVTIYVDEAPLAYPAMTKLTAFDLQRVEALKGPQGTLYGQNATGGAVNYIAAKPTDDLEAGVDLSYGRFNRLRIGGFVSGPIGDQLKVRLAAQAYRGDGWQKSITRPDDRLGRIRELQLRGTIQWQPDDNLASRLTVTLTHDGSDSLAAQFIAPAVHIPPLATPGLLTFPVVTKPRSADWTPIRPDTSEPFPYQSDTTLYHLAWRNSYRFGDAVTLVSLTAFGRLNLKYGQDPDGTPFHVDELIDRGGRVKSFFQELRLAGTSKRFNWLVGANYAHDQINDSPLEFFSDNDVGRLFTGLDPEAFADQAFFKSRIRVHTYAAFGRVEFNATDRLMVEAALRYNIDHRTFDSCDFAVTDHFARFWNLFRGGAPPPTTVGSCFVVDPANGFAPVGDAHAKLDQDSISWRGGLNWTARSGLLIFANASKGYKAGMVPVLAASTVDQYRPVPQESLLAYEAGVKAALFDRRAQLNASVFYYRYRDKQLRGALLDPVFGPLEALVSIPKSHVVGVEAELIARPLSGLTLGLSGTYVHTEIDRFVGFDALANFGNQAGTPFPYSPKWHGIANADYEFSAGDVRPFVGGTLIYNSKTYAGVGAQDLMRIDGYALMDLRAGVQFGDGRYRVWAWGKNVADRYYWTNVFANGNAIARFPGQPASFGVSLSGRF